MAVSRKSREAFGMSVLDMLCCGFGAAALLLILKDLQSSSSLAERKMLAEQKVAEVHIATQVARNYSKELQLFDEVHRRRLRDQGQPGAKFGISLENVQRAVVVLDTSGSMRVNDPADAIDQEKWDAAEKWKRTTALVDQLIAATPRLRDLAVLKISDVASVKGRCSVCYIMNGSASPWLEATADNLALLHARIAEISPSGGANAAPAILEALTLVDSVEATKPVDAIFLLTDGLPNVPGNSPAVGTPRTCIPISRCVQVETKRRLADDLVSLVGPRLTDIHARREGFKFHVIAMEWPDDAELPAFALALAGPTEGVIVFPND